MIKKFLNKLFRLAYRGVEWLAPPLAGRLAIYIFFRPMRNPRPRREQPILDSAKIERRFFSGYYPRAIAESYYTKYTWGQGEPILLVHGWGGRATQFSSIVSEFVDAGYQVVAFDAPAHGDSPGRRTNLLEFDGILRDLSTEYGRFQAIVAHSLGAVASARALTAGTTANRLVTIGAPATMEHLLEGFAQAVPATDRSLTFLKSHLVTLADQGIEEFSLLTHYPNLPTPTLTIHDRQDKSVAFSQAERLIDSNPKAKLIATEGLGHNRILSDPNVVSEILEFATSTD